MDEQNILEEEVKKPKVYSLKKILILSFLGLAIFVLTQYLYYYFRFSLDIRWAANVSVIIGGIFCYIVFNPIMDSGEAINCYILENMKIEVFFMSLVFAGGYLITRDTEVFSEVIILRLALIFQTAFAVSIITVIKEKSLKAFIVGAAQILLTQFIMYCFGFISIIIVLCFFISMFLLYTCDLTPDEQAAYDQSVEFGKTQAHDAKIVEQPRLDDWKQNGNY